MNDWELSPEDIVTELRKLGKDADLGWVSSEDTAIAIAAQKKLVEWGSESCQEHHASYYISVLRFGCYSCMVALRKELGLEE